MKLICGGRLSLIWEWLRNSRIKPVIAVAVEHIAQRLHVVAGAGVPVGKDDLVGLRDGIGIVRVEKQHGVVRARQAVWFF